MARTSYTARDFYVGQQVIFGRTYGEHTLGTVVRVNQKTITIHQLEPRGVHPVGTIWRVPPGYVEPALSARSKSTFPPMRRPVKKRAPARKPARKASPPLRGTPPSKAYARRLMSPPEYEESLNLAIEEEPEDEREYEDWAEAWANFDKRSLAFGEFGPEDVDYLIDRAADGYSNEIVAEYTKWYEKQKKKMKKR